MIGYGILKLLLTKRKNKKREEIILKILPNDYQNFIALSRYARWLPDKNRRETWEETVARYFDFMEWHLESHTNQELVPKTRKILEEAVCNLEVMPSMRALMTAGPALAKNNIAGYNCAYLSVDHPKAFDECLFILMHGTGVGFSVERQHINKLPAVPEIEDVEDVIVVQDSKEGWQSAFRKLITYLFNGESPNWDFSKVRPKGSRLKTFGGRASGPEPLVDLFHFTTNIFKEASGRNLTSYECHRLMCKIAEVVVVGGVRRSALISLSNLTDERMRSAKTGQWWIDTPEMALSNNSVCYTEKPDMGIFMKEWLSLYESKSGERGIFNREAAIKQVATIGRRDTEHEFGCNPCSEIILRDGQFCNLTEVVIRAADTQKDILRKVRLATILGTFQASLTNIKRLRPKWIQNTEEEALLGVSLTGIMDNSFMNGSSEDRGYYGKRSLPDFLSDLRKETVKINKHWSELLGISQATATTAIKPSGTVSQLVDSASGIHTRHNDYYLRRVRADSKDPIAQLMSDQGIPCENDVMKPDSVKVFTFPMKAPDGAVLRNDRTAIEQLELWLMYQRYYCEHKPSVTVSVRENEWMEVGAWVYKHFDEVSGVSFLPHSDHSYQQAPYEDCTKKEYNELAKKMPKSVDWDLISEYELTDTTTSSKTLACTGNVCEMVDLTEEEREVE
jgi:ribonucleoside-diphosphate reductase alpha chain